MLAMAPAKICDKLPHRARKSTDMAWKNTHTHTRPSSFYYVASWPTTNYTGFMAASWGQPLFKSGATMWGNTWPNTVASCAIQPQEASPGALVSVPLIFVCGPHCRLYDSQKKPNSECRCIVNHAHYIMAKAWSRECDTTSLIVAQCKLRGDVFAFSLTVAGASTDVNSLIPGNSSQLWMNCCAWMSTYTAIPLHWRAAYFWCTVNNSYPVLLLVWESGLKQQQISFLQYHGSWMMLWK